MRTRIPNKVLCVIIISKIREICKVNGLQFDGGCLFWRLVFVGSLALMSA